MFQELDSYVFFFVERFVVCFVGVLEDDFFYCEILVIDGWDSCFEDIVVYEFGSFYLLYVKDCGNFNYGFDIICVIEEWEFF